MEYFITVSYYPNIWGIVGKVFSCRKRICMVCGVQGQGIRFYEFIKLVLLLLKIFESEMECISIHKLIIGPKLKTK